MRPKRVSNILRLFWVLVIFWGEWGIFYRAGARCSWPEGSIPAEYSTKIMIVADPQILDMQSYPGRPWVLRLLSQVMVDLNLRRSWRAARPLRPDAVVFLGDMMDRGRRDMPDAEYEAYYRRFSSIFAQSEPVPTYYLPGNHDVGLGSYDSISPHSRARYDDKFGAVPSAISFGNFTLILIDAPLLVDEEASPGLAASPHLARIHQLARGAPGPVILFSHIPLARPDWTDCGPLREHGTIRAGVGRGYQNTLSSEMSRALLDAVRPVVVFSGDDHDYCDTSAGGVRDISVKSFSMAMGIRRPGFHVLSLIPQQTIGPLADSPFFFEKPCHLPDQLGIYLKLYVPFVVLSLIVLALYHLYQRTRGYKGLSKDSSESLPQPGVTTWRGGRASDGWARVLVRDVATIAWPPVLLFVTLACWTFL